MKRVVVTGIGIVSSLGNNCQEVLASLRNLKSGISFDPVYQEMGMRSHVAGNIRIDTRELIDRKVIRFMGDAAAFAYIAMQEAIASAGLTPEQVSNPRTGIVTGSGGASPAAQVEAADILREKGVKRVGAYGVTKTMASTVAACLSTPFQIKGVNYSISSACSTPRGERHPGVHAPPRPRSQGERLLAGLRGGGRWGDLAGQRRQVLP